jgi:hypothetical protein
VDITFNSVSSAVAGNVRGAVIESHREHCIFQR